MYGMAVAALILGVVCTAAGTASKRFQEGALPAAVDDAAESDRQRARRLFFEQRRSHNARFVRALGIALLILAACLAVAGLAS